MYRRKNTLNGAEKILTTCSKAVEPKINVEKPEKIRKIDILATLQDYASLMNRLLHTVKFQLKVLRIHRTNVKV